jgi:hypothetical protein
VTEPAVRLFGGRRDDGVSWDDAATALSTCAGWRELRREIDRSRRFRHDLVLMRMARIHRDGNGKVDLVRKLPARLRSTDSVWGVRKDVYVLLPEADRDVAVALIARLRRGSPGLLPGDVRLAAFPVDGLTRGALLDLLNKPSLPGGTALPPQVALRTAS